MNKILEHGEAQQRNDPDDLFPNRWVLVQDPEQSTFSTPTKPPVHSFTSGFVNASAESLKVFVAFKFGEQGLASNGRSDWIADDAFAVVDERTARDNSILFYVQQYVDIIRQAEVREAWGKGQWFFHCIPPSDADKIHRHHNGQAASQVRRGRLKRDAI